MILGLGAGILVLGLVSTGRRAAGTARRAAALFEDLDDQALQARSQNEAGRGLEGR
jgi:hypothetical protein